jgi:hypothetical protein
MFFKNPERVLADLSIDLHDEHDWKLGSLRILDFPVDITSLAVEPVIGLLAVGMYFMCLHSRPHSHPTRHIQWGYLYLWQSWSRTQTNTTAIDGDTLCAFCGVDM